MISIIQAITLLLSAIHLRNNAVNFSESGGSRFWRNILIINAFMIWLTLLGIVCHTLKGFSVFVNATIQVSRSFARWISCSHIELTSNLDFCYCWQQIFKKLVNLFLVSVIILMAFSTMFYLSAADSAEYCAVDVESGIGDYCSLNDSFEKVYTLFFGTLEAGGKC